MLDEREMYIYYTIIFTVAIANLNRDIISCILEFTGR